MNKLLPLAFKKKIRYSILLLIVLIIFSLSARSQTPAIGQTTFAGSDLAVSNQSSPRSAIINNYKFTVISSANVSIDEAANLLSLIGTTQWDEAEIAAGDGSAFELTDLVIEVNTAGFENKTLTITGYKSGSAVSGATTSVTIGTTLNTPIDINVSSITAFNDIDEITITPSAAVTPTSRLTVQSITIAAVPNPLPVTWLSFNATQVAGIYHWDWSLGTEQNVAYYIPQYSIDGKSFIDAGEITTLNNNHKYEFSEALSLAGSILFRVEEVGVNGNSTYSTTYSLKINSLNELSFYPNPATSQLSIQWPNIDATSVNTIIFNSKGEIVHEQSDAVSPSVKIALIGLAPGTYFIKCIDNKQNQSAVKSFIKITE